MSSSNQVVCSTCPSILETGTKSRFFDTDAYCNHCGTDALRDMRFQLTQENEYEEAMEALEEANDKVQTLQRKLNAAINAQTAAQNHFDSVAEAAQKAHQQVQESKAECCQGNEPETDEEDWDDNNDTSHDTSDYPQDETEED